VGGFETVLSKMVMFEKILHRYGLCMLYIVVTFLFTVAALIKYFILKYLLHFKH
jgi:hypothetical protein